MFFWIKPRRPFMQVQGFYWQWQCCRCILGFWGATFCLSQSTPSHIQKTYQVIPKSLDHAQKVLDAESKGFTEKKKIIERSAGFTFKRLFGPSLENSWVKSGSPKGGSQRTSDWAIHNWKFSDHAQNSFRKPRSIAGTNLHPEYFWTEFQ